MLPPYVLADLYRRRWGIEEALHLVKRLLGLSYLWTGSLKGVQLQVWATWLFYGVLVDLSDAVAEELAVPWERISLEMGFRGLYHYGLRPRWPITVAYNKGKATDPVRYFAAAENQRLRVVKVLRKPEEELNLDAHPT